MLEFLELLYLASVMRIVDSPIDDRLAFFVYLWWAFPVVFALQFWDFAIFGSLIAVGFAPWRRVADRRLLYRAKLGAGIGIMVGCTYFTISATIYVINQFAREHDCAFMLPYHMTQYEYILITPYLRAHFPTDGTTCLSLSVESIAFFLCFMMFGIGISYIRGRNETTNPVKETVPMKRLVKGAVFGVLTAGTLTPVMILLDILFNLLWRWIGIV